MIRLYIKYVVTGDNAINRASAMAIKAILERDKASVCKIFAYPLFNSETILSQIMAIKIGLGLIDNEYVESRISIITNCLEALSYLSNVNKRFIKEAVDYRIHVEQMRNLYLKFKNITFFEMSEYKELDRYIFEVLKSGNLIESSCDQNDDK